MERSSATHDFRVASRVGGPRHHGVILTESFRCPSEIWACLRANISGVSMTDTSPSAQALQLQIQRAMTGEQRILLALEMSLFARDLSRTRIRQEHPEWPESAVDRELIRLAFLPAPMPAGLR